jgi:hypothetical protein
LIVATSSGGCAQGCHCPQIGPTACQSPNHIHRALAALEKAGDAIQETGQKFADAQKMPDLGEDDKLTKDGLFYTVKNDNKFEEDDVVRSGKMSSDKMSPDTPFSENMSKGSIDGSDSTKPEVPGNVEEKMSQQGDYTGKS